MALRLNESVGRLTTCLREPDFRGLYAVLGNRDSQDAIRTASPEVKHCRWLMDAPLACEQLPESLGEYAGSVCPNNPYHKYREQHVELAAHGQLLEEAFYVGDLAALGQLPGPEELSPEDFQIARIMHSHYRSEELRARVAMSMGGGEGE